MTQATGYDQQCYDLARSFLVDDTEQGGKLWHEKDVPDLARLIQRTVEDFIENEAPR